MTTILDIVTRAHRKIGVVAIDEPLTADQAGIGLMAYNHMVSGWQIEGIDAGLYESDMGDQFDLDDKFINATVHLLAAELAPEYGVGIGFDPEKFKRQVQTAFCRKLTVQIPNALLHTGRVNRGFRR